jgi:serine/threonine-protein kinase
VSTDGTLVYVPGDAAMGIVRRLVWVEPSGTITPLAGLADALYNDIRISPEGTKIAVLIGASGSGDVWLYDVGRTTFTRLTFTGRNSTPTWSADGQSVYYSEIEPTGLKSIIWRRPADGSRAAEQVTTVDSRANITAIQTDAAIVDYYGLTQNKTNVLRVPFKADAKSETLVGTQYDEYGAALSRDERWLAYQSDETGRFEIYVRDLSPGGGRHQVSTTLGEEPKWAPDGKTLYYRSDDLLMAVPVETVGAFSSGKARVFFKGAHNLRSDTGISFDVDRKLPRLLMIRPAVDRQSPPVVRVVLNWFTELGLKVDGR